MCVCSLNFSVVDFTWQPFDSPLIGGERVGGYEGDVASFIGGFGSVNRQINLLKHL